MAQHQQKAVASLSEIRDLLGLPGLPARIECYDISNTPKPTRSALWWCLSMANPESRYRKFKIKTVAGANDVASIQEVIRRRLGTGGPRRPATL